MPNKCKEYQTCNFTLPYRQGLEGPDKNSHNYVLTACLEGGKEDCPHDKKTLDKKLKEDSNE